MTAGLFDDSTQETVGTGDAEIFTMNPDGSNQVDISNDPGASDTGGNFSPDGQQIVFVSNRSGSNQIYTMNPDGSDQTRITNDAGVDVQAHWTSDGRIVFLKPAPFFSDLWIMNADGTHQHQLTFGETDRYPAPSALGQVAFGRATSPTTIGLLPDRPRRRPPPADHERPDSDRHHPRLRARRALARHQPLHQRGRRRITFGS